MEKINLNLKEIIELAKMSNEIGSFGQIIFALEIKASNYEWQQLLEKMKEVIELFDIIKENSNE